MNNKIVRLNRYLLLLVTLILSFIIVGCVSLPNAEEVTLSDSSIEIAIGEEFLVTAIVKPNDADQKVIWISTTPTIASVDNGIIKGLLAGKTIIKATSGDITADIAVFVYDPVNPYANTITVSKDNVDIVAGEEIDITATVTPEAASVNLSWVSNKPNIASVNNGKIRGISDGVAEISVSSGTASAKVIVTVAKPTTGMLTTALDENNYLNFTITNETNISILGEELTTNSVTYVDGIKSFTSTTIEEIVSEQYVVEVDELIFLALRTRFSHTWGEWIVQNIDADSGNEINFTEFVEADFTFINGFYVLQKEKAMQYTDFLNLSDNEVNLEINSFTLRLRVNQGLLRMIIMEIETTVEEVTTSMEILMEISEFGTTTVNIPTEVFTAIDEYRELQ